MRDGFQAGLVVGVESVEHRTVQVEHADQLAVALQRHHQFRTRGRVAGDVSREGVDVGDALGLPRARRRAAHALVQRDAHAGGLALERADHQLGAVEEIEADPVELRQRVVDQRGKIGRVGDAVALAVQQRARLPGQLCVLLRLAAGKCLRRERHAAILLPRLPASVTRTVTMTRKEGESGRRPMTPLFVTGTDTGIGKTLVSCALLQTLRARGLRAVGMKPLASGCETTPEGLRNEDALALQAASDPRPAYDDVNQYALPAPLAPEIAAREAGIAVELAPMLAAHARLAAQADVVVVEGVGGWAAPMAPSLMQADLVRALDVPVVLVVGLRLGWLNHAILSARAIAADGCRLAGWIGSGVDPAMLRIDENRALLAARLPAPCLGWLPWQAAPDPVALAPSLRLSP